MKQEVMFLKDYDFIDAIFPDEKSIPAISRTKKCTCQSKSYKVLASPEVAYLVCKVCGGYVEMKRHSD